MKSHEELVQMLEAERDDLKRRLALEVKRSQHAQAELVRLDAALERGEWMLPEWMGHACVEALEFARKYKGGQPAECFGDGLHVGDAYRYGGVDPMTYGEGGGWEEYRCYGSRPRSLENHWGGPDWAMHPPECVWRRLALELGGEKEAKRQADILARWERVAIKREPQGDFNEEVGADGMVVVEYVWRLRAKP